MSLFFDLIDRKVARVLTNLVNNPDELFHIQKLSSLAKLPLSSTFRIVNKLAKLGTVDVKIIGKFKIYQLNKKRKDELKELFGGSK